MKESTGSGGVIFILAMIYIIGSLFYHNHKTNVAEKQKQVAEKQQQEEQSRVAAERQRQEKEAQEQLAIQERIKREKEDFISQAKSFRIWTDTKGRQMTARYLGSQDKFLILVCVNDKTTTIEKSILSVKDKKFVRSIENIPELEPVWNEDLPDIDKIHFVRKDAKIQDENGTAYPVLMQRVTAYARKGTLYAVWYWRSQAAPRRKGLVHSSDFISQSQYVATVKAIQAEKERLAEAEKQAELERGDQEYHRLERGIASRREDSIYMNAEGRCYRKGENGEILNDDKATADAAFCRTVRGM
jgi:hypothetical protein